MTMRRHTWRRAGPAPRSRDDVELLVALMLIAVILVLSSLLVPELVAEVGG